jgi:hypothetical protein
MVFEDQHEALEAAKHFVAAAVYWRGASGGAGVGAGVSGRAGGGASANGLSSWYGAGWI